MLTICAYFDASTINLIPKIQDIFPSSDLKIIAYTPYDCTYDHPDVTITIVSGFSYPTTSVLLEASHEVEQMLFIFDVVDWLANPLNPLTSTTIQGQNVKQDIDVESLYDDCFHTEEPISHSIQTFLTAIHV